ncbi:MAG: hypothetical protein DMF29_07050 [Verrucomicrobia bacterium]|nr:MAG: hypothetical protein DMF29_07050 [Verrucomicrobiota bacterium]
MKLPRALIHASTMATAKNSTTATAIRIGSHGFHSSHCPQSCETTFWFAPRDGKPPKGKLKPIPAKCPARKAAKPMTNHFFKSNGRNRSFFISSNASSSGLRISILLEGPFTR